MTAHDPKVPERKSRVLIVDDNPLIREGLAGRIARQPDMEVCGQAAEMGDALNLARTTRPDLMIIDLALRRGDGLDLIKRVRSWNKRIRMLVCSMYDAELYADRAFRAGATGYINKQEMPDRIVDAMRRVLAGDTYLTARAADRTSPHAANAERRSERTSVSILTDRELEVFKLIGRGLKTGAIAARLGVSRHTIDAHRTNIKAKLQFADSGELTRNAVQWVLEND